MTFRELLAGQVAVPFTFAYNCAATHAHVVVSPGGAPPAPAAAPAPPPAAPPRRLKLPPANVRAHHVNANAHNAHSARALSAHHANAHSAHGHALSAHQASAHANANANAPAAHRMARLRAQRTRVSPLSASRWRLDALRPGGLNQHLLGASAPLPGASAALPGASAALRRDRRRDRRLDVDTFDDDTFGEDYFGEVDFGEVDFGWRRDPADAAEAPREASDRLGYPADRSYPASEFAHFRFLPVLTALLPSQGAAAPGVSALAFVSDEDAGAVAEQWESARVLSAPIDELEAHAIAMRLPLVVVLPPDDHDEEGGGDEGRDGGDGCEDGGGCGGGDGETRESEGAPDERAPDAAPQGQRRVKFFRAGQFLSNH